MTEKRDFFGWWKTEKKEETFTVEEVKELLEEVKEFNCGAIDQYLSNHVDETFNSWLESKSGE